MRASRRARLYQRANILKWISVFPLLFQTENKYFDVLINDLDLDVEIKNLVIFKKGLFNSEFAKENELLNILNPVIKSQSIWKGHALYLMGEYYFSKNEMQKSKEFFDQIVSLEKISPKIKLEAQKRLRTNFSE